MDGSRCTGPLLRALLEKQVIPGETVGSLWFDLILIFILVFINAFFSATEMAVIAQNDNKIRQMAEKVTLPRKSYYILWTTKAASCRRFRLG